MLLENMSRKIFQKKLPFIPWSSKNLNRLPGTQFLGDQSIFVVDDVYTEQMKYKEFLLKKKTFLL